MYPPRQGRVREDRGSDPILNDGEIIDRSMGGKVTVRVRMCASGKPRARLFAKQPTSLSPGKSLCERVMAEKAKRTRED